MISVVSVVSVTYCRGRGMALGLVFASLRNIPRTHPQRTQFPDLTSLKLKHQEAVNNLGGWGGVCPTAKMPRPRRPPTSFYVDCRLYRPTQEEAWKGPGMSGRMCEDVQSMGSGPGCGPTVDQQM